MPLFAKGLEVLLPNGVDRWVGLLAAAPDEIAGTYQEIDDADYQRTPHAAWVSADNGDGRLARRNSGAVVFGNNLLAETTVSHWGIFDAEVAGNLIAAAPVLNGDGEPQPAVIPEGDQPRFNDGDLQLLSREVA